MITLFRRNTLFFNQLRQLHKSAVSLSGHSQFDFNSEKKAFLDVLPEVQNCILTSPKLTKLPAVQNWLKQILDYNVCGGKLYRGLSTSTAFRMLEEPEDFSEEQQHKARVLGWCTEMLQAHFIIADDLVDGSTMRRGKPCWYIHSKIGMNVVNDALLLYQSLMEVIHTYFGKTSVYADLVRCFNETVHYSAMGQHLDFSSCYNKEQNNIDLFNIDHYNQLAIYKTGYCSFKLPISLALHLVKNGKEKASKELEDICLELGRLLQIQDDYLDVYGNETIMGKVGTDIQEGKCSWMAVAAFQRCNEVQRYLFQEYYGSKDPEHVKRIKQLYNELQMEHVYQQYERTVYEDLLRRINELPAKGGKEFLIGILNTYYKRLH